MADESNGAAPAETVAPRLQVLTQYVRDLSFENIAAQKGIGSDGKPDVRVTVNIDAQPKPSDRYEVALKVKVDSKLADKPIFILELDYAGLFLIQNVPPEQMTALLMIECPRQIFPYVRRIVGDVTRDGGYPPLNLEQIDFLALYRSEIARRQAEATKPRAQASPRVSRAARARPGRVRQRRRHGPRPRPPSAEATADVDAPGRPRSHPRRIRRR